MFGLFRTPFATVEFRFGSAICHVRHLPVELPATTHVLIYASYLTRFFYICDERQLQPVRSFIQRLLEEPSQINPGMHDAMFETAVGALSADEQSAARSFFRFPVIAPIFLGEQSPEDEYGSRRFGFYSYRLFQRRDRISDQLKMTHALNVILLPLSVSLLTLYTVRRIAQEDSALERFRDVTSDILLQPEPRSVRTLQTQATEINLQYALL